MQNRIAVSGGHVYYRAERVPAPDACLFDIDHWRKEGSAEAVSTGRGAAWFITTQNGRRWVLRHYRRGGFVGKFNRRVYFYTGERRTRAYREWQVLEYLEHHALPGPRPVAARYSRRGPFYRADIITERIPNTHPLSDRLRQQTLPEETWQAIGSCIGEFHQAGVCHGDLNAHNILINDEGQVWLIDFDKARITKSGSWRKANLARLARSLNKLKAESTAFHYKDSDWSALRAGYETVRK